MSDATITHLVPRAGLRSAAPRDCGVARVIALPERPTGRLIEPLPRTTPPRSEDLARGAHLPTDDPGPLARALMAMPRR
jgi:hypothetical protein